MTVMVTWYLMQITIKETDMSIASSDAQLKCFWSYFNTSRYLQVRKLHNKSLKVKLGCLSCINISWPIKSTVKKSTINQFLWYRLKAKINNFQSSKMKKSKRMTLSCLQQPENFVRWLLKKLLSTTFATTKSFACSTPSRATLTRASS